METHSDVSSPLPSARAPAALQGREGTPRRARRQTLPFSLGVSLIAHASLVLVAWAHRPYAVMAGGGTESSGSFTIAISPRRSAASRGEQSAKHEVEEQLDALEVVEEPLVIPAPELVPIDLPDEDPRPELSQLGGPPLADVDWEKHPWNFHSRAPAETAASPKSGSAVDAQPGASSEGEARESVVEGEVVATGPAVPGGSRLSSSAHAGEASSPGVPGGDGPVLIRDRSKDPEYPRRAQQRRIEGKVLLRLTISSRGLVSEVELVESSGHSILDRAAIEGVEKWVFEPAKRNGVPVETEILHYITFKLDDT